MKTTFKNLFLSKEVRQALKASREAANHAMEAKSTIDSIYVTEKLAAAFGRDNDIAVALKEDYYTELLIGKMLGSKEEQETEQRETVPA